ncbi:MAG: DNA-binding beta-propeller fold protein YncE/DNA-binding beta-propeller fold protein YncE [Candidatus Methanocomedens sp.]|nr:MAG: DNA-binding beta-propeller fold protein YncE/DNA-binding beta-propeller fold protein YncE [ANME-2 cluster archaeon]
MTDEIKRMRYFDGLFLTEEEFNLEQNYHNRLRRLHNRHLHSWGIVWGLDVVHGPGSKEVTVEEGMSLNRVLVDGEEVSQEIILTSNTSVDLSGYAPEDSVYIYISYFEEAVDFEEGGTEKIHWRENAVLGHSKTRPQNENENIILAKVVLKPEDGTIDANSITDEEDGISLRTYAGFSGKLLEVQKLTFGIEGVTSNLASMEGKIIDTENGIQVNSPRTNFTGNLDVAGILTGSLADDIIGTDQIVNNAVTAIKIKDGSIGNVKLADNSVNDTKIVDGSVGNKKLADNSVNAAKIADESVGTIELAGNAVNSDKLQSDTVDDNLRAVNTDHIKDSAVTEVKLEQSIRDKLATVVSPEMVQEIEDARGIKEKLGNRLDKSLTAGGQLREKAVSENNLDASVKNRFVDLSRIHKVPLLQFTVFDKVVATVSVGGGSFGIAFDGTHIWVTIEQSDTVSKIDINSNDVTTVSVGENPGGIAFDGTYIWVTNERSETVSKIDINSDDVTTVSVGDHPRGIAFDGTYIWVANYRSRSISKIDISSDDVVTFSVDEYPSDIAFDGTHIWVTNENSETVSKIDKTTNDIMATVSVKKGKLRGIAFDGTHIWVTKKYTNEYTEDLLKIDITTNNIMTTVSVGVDPWGIVFDGTHIWVANNMSWSVSKIDIKSNTVVATVSEVKFPHGIAFDGTHIWVTGGITVSKIKKIT